MRYIHFDWISRDKPRLCLTVACLTAIVGCCEIVWFTQSLIMELASGSNEVCYIGFIFDFFTVI